MNARMNAVMQEAARLTRAGKLLEATAAVQRLLGRMRGALPAAERAAGAAKAPIEGGTDVIDAEFETIDADPAATVPPGREAPRGASSGSTETVRDRMPWARIDLSALHKQWREFRGPLAEPKPNRAPEPLPDGAQFITGAYSNAAGTRSYKLYVPSGYHGQPLPLIVMLHGCTQDPDDFAAGTRMNELAERQPCFVLYPAQALAANGSKCWNWFKASDQHRDGGEPSIIAGITREVCDTFAVDARRIYVAGLSAGGAMALTMAINYPEFYAAVGIHSGLPHAVARDLPSALALMQQGAASPLGRPAHAISAAPPLPAIVFHGDRDTTVHPGNGDQVIAQCARPPSARRAPAETDPLMRVQAGRVPNGHAYTRTTYCQTDGQPVAEHWLIHGAGHAWSGGSARGSYTDPKGPDATAQLFRFFFEHPRR